MSALLDLHPDLADAMSAGVAELHGVIDRLHAGANVGAQSGAAVVEVDRAIRRLEALKLKLVAAADKAGAAKDAGFTDTNAWVAKTTTVSRSDAARQVALATELESGHDATAEALDAGLVSPGPCGGDRARHRSVARHGELGAAAGRRSPPGREGQPLQPRPTAPGRPPRDRSRRTRPERRRCPRERARPLRRASGAGQVLVHAARQRRRHQHRPLHRPRPRRRDARQDPRHDDRTPTDARARLRHATPDRSFDWRHRRGLAFAELLEHLPTDHLHPKSAATVVVTIDHTVLAGALKAAHLDTARHSPPAKPAALACTAAHPPRRPRRAIRRPRPRPRQPPLLRAQRLAKGLEHTTCAAAGCERPYAWCELHHRKPWATGGKTDLKNAIPLCHRHHQWIHDTGFNHQSMPDGSVRFSRRT